MKPCEKFNNCDLKIRSNACLTAPENVVVLCSRRLKFRKEQSNRQSAIKRILARAKKLNW